MDFKNIEKINPEVFKKISSVNRGKLEEYYGAISIITDISDKSYENKEISSPYIAKINDSYLVDYFLGKYSINGKEWLDFLIDVNRSVGKLDSRDIDLIIGDIDNISKDFFQRYIPLTNKCDIEFFEKLDIKVRDGINDYELMVSGFSEITYQLMEQSVISKGLILEIIIDGISASQTFDEIVFRINNLFEAYGQ